MKKPTNIIDKDLKDLTPEQIDLLKNGSWGSFDETTKLWTESVFSGKTIRQWILRKLPNFYGPYESVEAAITAIPVEYRDRGLTVAIFDEYDGIVEYQWKSGTANEDLVQKVEQANLTITAETTTYTVDEGNDILLTFSVSGLSNIQKCNLYRWDGEREIFVREYTSVIKGENTITIPALSSSGEYIYRVKVIDTAGNAATSRKGGTRTDYIEYTVRYGGLSININTTPFDRIKVKNIESVSGVEFSATITKRDDSFNILGVYFSDENNHSIELTLPSGSYEGNNTYTIPSKGLLSEFSGKCNFVIKYTEDGELKYLYKFLFTLLDLDSLELISETSSDNIYYVNYPALFKFRFESGKERLSVHIKMNNDSDFSFDEKDYSVYYSQTLNITPKEISGETKEDAYLKLDCTYYIDGTLKTKTFSERIGSISKPLNTGYYIPREGSDISFDGIVNPADPAETVIFNGDGEPSESYRTNAFILDLYCKIPQTGDKTTTYITIKNSNQVIGTVTEDIIEVNNSKKIITDTPLNEWTLITIGYDIEETISRVNTDKTSIYDAIYIDGMIVLNSGWEKTTPKLSTGEVSITLSNGIEVLKCFIYYNNNPGSKNTINPNVEGSTNSISYHNYKFYKIDSLEPEDLPVLKLNRITEGFENIYNKIKEYYGGECDLKYLTKFGEIGAEKCEEMSSGSNPYDMDYGNQVLYHPNATLFRQATSIKKPAQKEYGVLCAGEYIVNGVNLLEGCVIEVHTQGTSTLQYSLPNFKLTFWKNDSDNKFIRFNPEFIKKSDGEGYYLESIYTAKADFMDSSHLNNTPTCNYYNTLIQNLIKDEVIDFEGSPAAKNGYLDAIMGFPIIMEINDSEGYLNIGSFMLNIDKTGDSLGFEILDLGGDRLSCISFEGLSNEDGTGEAGRFIKPDNLVYFTDEAEINTAYGEASDAIDTESINKSNLSTYKYAAWCNFLSEGLEYRYPDGDIIKFKGDNVSKLMNLNHFKKLYEVWSWVSKSDTMSNEAYKDEFINYFDLNYCMLYFIQLMAYALTDNLGKNMMFDIWGKVTTVDGEETVDFTNALCYPRPYDLDSLAGLDNAANPYIAPFVEIKPEFSLNYRERYAGESEQEYTDWKRGEYLLDDSTILYAGKDLERYHFSSNTSKLWINFYKNFKSEIEYFYGQLRNNANYSAEDIIDSCKELVIDTLGTNQYNLDFRNKYLATTEQWFSYGNRWYKFKKWMKLRFAFCDSYFGNNVSITYFASGYPEFNVKVESPFYMKLAYQTNSSTYFIVDNRLIPKGGSGAATMHTMLISDGLVLSSGHFKYFYPRDVNYNFNGLIKLDISNDKLSNSNTLALIVGYNSNSTEDSLTPRLVELNISDSAIGSLKEEGEKYVIPRSLKKLVARNVTLDGIHFPDNCLIEEIDLTGSTINTTGEGGDDLMFHDLKNLKKLNLTNCTLNNISFRNLPSLESFVFTGANFTGWIKFTDNVGIKSFDFSGMELLDISFDGSDIDIEELNFFRTRFNNPILNINAISDHIEVLNFNECSGLQHLQMSNNFKVLKQFQFYKSEIVSLGEGDGTNRIFDASKFNSLENNVNMSGLKMWALTTNSSTEVSSYNMNGTTHIMSGFNFLETAVEKILGLNWNGSCENLFRNCDKLLEITGEITVTNSANFMFRGCNILNLDLNSPLTINIDDNTTTAQYTFARAHNISWDFIKEFIKDCQYVSNFTRMCYGKLFDFDASNIIEIDLGELFDNNSATSLNLSYMFGAGGRNESIYPEANNEFTVLGQIPSKTTHTSGMFRSGDSSIKHVTLNLPYNIILAASSLSNASYMFRGSIIKFNGSSLSSDHIIDKTFFYKDNNDLNNVLTTIVAMFASSNIEIKKDIFENLLALSNCQQCFASTVFENLVELEGFWSTNKNLTNVRGCFYDVINISLNSSLNLFNENVKNLDISGLFGINSTTAVTPSLNINLEDIYKYKNNLNRNITITEGPWTSYTGSTVGAGVFHNRRDISINSDSFLYITSSAYRMFLNCNITIENEAVTIDLSSVKYGYYMFCNCLFYTTDNGRQIRKFVKVLLPTNCTNMSYMFYLSKLLKELPKLRSQNLLNASYMFAGANSNTDSIIIASEPVIIPADYFQICKNSILNVERMFLYNLFITGLEYDSNCGLFENCENINNVKYMFHTCRYLQGGIPNNIFGQEHENPETGELEKSKPLNNLKSLEGMFRYSTILYSIPKYNNDSKYYIEKSTFADYLPNLEDIRLLFMYTRYSGVSGYSDTITDTNNSNPKYIIAPDTFDYNITLNYIEEAFAYSPITAIPILFREFKYGKRCFLYSLINTIANPFVTGYINKITDVSQMFYKSAGSTTLITNLNSFIDAIAPYSNIIKDNVAGNVLDPLDLIDDRYQEPMSNPPDTSLPTRSVRPSFN